MMNPIRCTLILIPTLFCFAVQAQELQFGWIMPDLKKTNLPVKDISYLPEGGLNLYDKPNGEVIGRLNRDLRSRDYPKYLLNIFLHPRNRKPALISQMTLAPLPQNCYAIPFVKQENNFVLLFDRDGPEFYWVDVQDLESSGYFLTDKIPQPRQSGETVNLENQAGLLIPDFEKLQDLPRENFAYMPSKGVAIYESPDGASVSKLSRFCPVAKYADGNMRMFVLPNKNLNECRQVMLTHLHHLSDETYVIPYFKNEKGFVLLFDQEVLGPTWGKVEDIVSQDFRMVDWKSYFIEKRSTPAFANDPGLNLRDGPYADAARIVTIKGETMEIVITGFDDGFCEGPWCKVKVNVYKESRCKTSASEADNLQRVYEGWIKIVGDDGLPNIHINTKGC